MKARSERVPAPAAEPSHSAEQANRPSPAAERRRRLLDLVEQQGYCTIIDLSSELSVSDMTVRRDVRMLEQKGYLRSVHGGVTVLPQAMMTGTDFRLRNTRMSAAKRAIARKAVEFVPARGAIAIDSGTTTLELARILPTSAQITVVTPSLPVVNALLMHEHVNLICPGGHLHAGSESFRGPATVAAISELRVQTLFLAGSGVRGDGVYSGSDLDAVTKRALVAAADEVVLVVDSTKFSTSAMIRACSRSDLDLVITDDGIPEEDLRSLLADGVDVAVVPVQPDGS